jgi:hypothetical protein
MRWLQNFIWRAVEPRVQAVVTERLLEFEAALVERGQIRRSYPPEPPRELPTARYTGCSTAPEGPPQSQAAARG